MSDGRGKKRPYTAREDEMILNAFRFGGMEGVAARIGRSKQTLYVRRAKLNDAVQRQDPPPRRFDPFNGNEALRARAMAGR